MGTLGNEDGAYAVIVLARMTGFLEERGTIRTDAIISDYRRRLYSVDDAALSFIDGTVTQLKRIGKEKEELPGELADALAKSITLLEKVIDATMSKSPGKVLPYNGQFAKMAEDVGLDKYFTAPK